MGDGLWQAYLKQRASDSLNSVTNSSTDDLSKRILADSATPTNFQPYAGSGDSLSPIQRITALLSVGQSATAGYAKGLMEMLANINSGHFSPSDLGRSTVAAIEGAGTNVAQALFDAQPTAHVTDWTENVKRFEQLADPKNANLDAAGLNAATDRSMKDISLPEAGLGLAGNILLDPTTYVGVGAVKDLYKAITGVKDAADAVSGVSKAGDIIEQNGQRVFVAGDKAPVAEVPKPQLAIGPGAGLGHASVGEAPQPIFDAIGKGALFPAKEARGGILGGSPAQAGRLNAERGLAAGEQATPDIPQSALFNFNPNPKVDKLVPNIAAYPPRVVRAAEDAAVAPDVPVKAPVSPVETTAPQPGVTEPVSGSPVSGAPAASEAGAGLDARKAYAGKVLREIIGTKDTKPDSILIGQVGEKPVQATAGEIAKAIRSGNIPDKLKGVSFADANGDLHSIENLVAKAPETLLDKVKGKAPTAPVISADISKVIDSGGLLDRPVIKPASGVIDSVASGEPASTSAAREILTPSAEAGKAASEKNLGTANSIIEAHLDKQVPLGGYVYRNGQQIRTGPFKYNPKNQADVFTKLYDAAAKGSIRGAKGQAKLDKALAADKTFEMLKQAEARATALGHPPVAFSNKTFFPLKLSDFIASIAHDKGITPGQFIQDFKNGEDYAKEAWSAFFPKGGSTNTRLFQLASKYPTLDQLVQNVSATGAMATAADVKTAAPVVQEVTTAAENLAGNTQLGDAVVASETPRLINNVVDNTLTDASAVEKESTAKALNDIIKQGQKPVEPVAASVERTKASNMEAVASGHPSVKAGWEQAKAAREAAASEFNFAEGDMGKMLDGPAGVIKDTGAAQSVDRALGKRLGASGMMDWLKQNLVESEGIKDIYHPWKGATARGIMLAEWRNVAFNKIAKDFTPEQISAGLKQYLGRAPVSSDPAVTQASKFFQNRVDSLWGNSNVAQHLHAGNTVATANGLTMDQLNRHLASVGLDFRFTGGKAVDMGGGVVKDFSKGIDWIHEIEAGLAKAKDPLDFLNRAEMGMQRALNEKLFWDQIGKEFGSKTLTATQTRIVNHPQLQGIHFSPDIAGEVVNLANRLDEFHKAPGQLLRFYDQVLNMWKTSATQYNVSHHLNNLMGDTFFAWLAGVPVRYFAKGIKAMTSHPGLYHDIKAQTGVDKFMNALYSGDSKALDLAKGNNAGSNIVSRMQLGGKQIDLTGTDYLTAMQERGALPGFRSLQDLNNVGSTSQTLFKFKPLGGYGSAAVKHIAEGREHYVRLSHFIYKTEKYVKSAPGKTTADKLNYAFDKAAADVRKWHPAGDGMTNFERNTLRRIIPFYSWTRKAIPLLVESAAAHPGKLIAPQKAMYALAQQQGVAGPSLADPFPTDGLFPNWMHALPFGPQMGYQGGLLQGTNPNGGMISMQLGGLPFQGLGAQFLNDPLHGILGATSPLFRIPAEWASGHEFQTGAAIKDSGEWAQKQIPLVATGMRITNVNPLGALTGNPLTAKGQKDGPGNALALWNWLTGTGALDVSRPSYQKQAVADTTARIKQAAGQ